MKKNKQGNQSLKPAQTFNEIMANPILAFHHFPILSQSDSIKYLSISNLNIFHNSAPTPLSGSKFQRLKFPYDCNHCLKLGHAYFKGKPPSFRSPSEKPFSQRPPCSFPPHPICSPPTSCWACSLCCANSFHLSTLQFLLIPLMKPLLNEFESQGTQQTTSVNSKENLLLY